MSLSTSISALAQSLRDELYTYKVDNWNTEVLVETYRLDSQVMENTNMKGIRIAIYDGGDSVASAIPGYAQQRGDRVQWGVPYATIQTLNFDLAFFIAERDMDGWNELELIRLKDAVSLWIAKRGLDVSTVTGGALSTFVYGSSNGVTRLRKYAYTTITAYAVYHPEIPNG
jgi:hypothetical protein